MNELSTTYRSAAQSALRELESDVDLTPAERAFLSENERVGLCAFYAAQLIVVRRARAEIEGLGDLD